MNHEYLPRAAEDRVVWVEEQVAELLLLLPGRQAAELERLANSRGLSMGQLIRQLIRDHLTDRGGPSLSSDGQEAGSVAVRRGIRFDSHAPIPSRRDL
jgi:hypothetical protein